MLKTLETLFRQQRNKQRWEVEDLMIPQQAGIHKHWLQVGLKTISLSRWNFHHLTDIMMPTIWIFYLSSGSNYYDGGIECLLFALNYHALVYNIIFWNLMSGENDLRF